MSRPTLSALGFVAALAVCGAVLAAGLAGPLTVVVTHGVSMEPTYTAGDVVVVRKAPTYAVDDIAAYHSPMLDQVVLHRIVDTADDGFVLSGDNNSWLDPERFTGDELLGTAWVHVPKVGLLARWLQAHTALAAAGALVLVAATGTTAVNKKRKQTRTVTKPSKPARKVHTPAPDAGRRQLVGGLLAGLLAFGLLAAVAWTRPTTTDGPVEYTHDGEFTYSAKAAAGPVYDAARVETGEPLFLRLVRDVRVGFAYQFTADEPATIRGTIGLDAEITNGSGWSRTIEIAEPRDFDGDEAQVAGALDLDTIRTLVAEVAESTGESGSATITLHPVVTVDGDVGGEPIEERFAPSLAYTLTDTQLRVAEGSDETDGFTAEQTGEVQLPDREPAVLSWAGRTMEIPTARMLSTVAAAVCALGLLVVPLASRRPTGRSEADQIVRRWPDLIVAVQVENMLSGRVVRVADMAALVALAQRSDRLVLHDRAANTFLVDLDGTHYHYEPAPPPVPAVPPATRHEVRV